MCTLQVLVAASSNIAVDNLVDRLTTADPKLMVVRVGHPARLLPQVQRKTLFLASMVPEKATISFLSDLCMGEKQCCRCMVCSVPSSPCRWV